MFTHCDAMYVSQNSAIDTAKILKVAEPCVSCKRPVSLNSPELKEILDFAIVEYDKSSDERELHRIVKVRSAEKEVIQ